MKAGKLSKKLSKTKRWLLVLTVRGMGGVAAVLATWVASRLLGAESAGVLFLAFAIVTVLSTLSRLGLESTVVRFVSVHASKNEWAQVAAVLVVAMKWAGLTSLAVAVALFLSAGALAEYAFHMPTLAPVLRIMAWLVPLMALYWLCAQGFVGLRRPEIATTLQNNCLPLGFIALLLAALYMAAPWPGEVTAAAAYTVAGAATFSLGLMLLGLRVQRYVARNVKIDTTAIWNSAKSLWVVTAMGQAVIWSGQLAAGALLAPKDVAHLASAQRCAMLISLVLVVVAMLVSPDFATKYHQGDITGLKKSAQRATRLMAAMATAIAFIMFFFAEEIMSLFGDDFGKSVSLLIILVFGQWVNVTTGSVSLLLKMSGHERDLRNIVLCTGMLSIFLAAILTFKFGTLGAAWATALALITENCAAFLMVKRRLGFYTIG